MRDLEYFVYYVIKYQEIYLVERNHAEFFLERNNIF